MDYQETSLIIDQHRALDILSKLISDQRSRIVDLGCGNEKFINQLKEAGFTNVVGVDYKKIIGGSAIEIDISYESLPFDPGSIDIVTAWETMEHLENPYLVIKEVWKVLKPGGLFTFSMPNIFHWSNKIFFPLYGNFLRYTRTNDHRTLFTKDLFEKSFLVKFSLVGSRYRVPVWWPQKVRGFPWGRMNLFVKKYLENKFPENELFSHFIIYILKKRPV